MITKCYAFVLLTSISLGAFADGNPSDNSQRTDIRYITNNKRMPDVMYQEELRERKNWQDFVAVNGNWYVIFNEENAKPHRAFGEPILISGSNAEDKAMNFITSKLGGFTIPLNELNYRSTATSENFDYVHFDQKHNGLKVLNADVYVKMTLDGRVITFGCDVYPDITISTTPTISSAQAISSAKAGLNNAAITGATINNNLFILPIPEFKQNIYKLVYEVIVETTNADGMPANYYTLVDAETGKILERKDLVKHHKGDPNTQQPAPAANTDVTIRGTLYTTNPYNPSSSQLLKNLKMVSGGTTYYTDANGYIGLTNTTATNATFTLEGRWSQVKTGSTIPTYTVTLNPGANNLTFTKANIRELSAYYHVNIVHDYMKTKFPAFTTMDNALPTNVDLTSGTCNAFYNGTSINFYAKAGGCNSLAQTGDVVYHEYGHGINDKFYQSQGGSFNNGGMNEGYADIWAMGITNNPVMGIGFNDTDPNVFIRRYDINKKIYPQDLVGEVHADGEIIAGCWWDTNLNFANLQKMMNLFKETFYATVSGPDGTEGQVYVDVLVEALTSDDITANGGDNNINNGTPNDIKIVDAFALHGITLLSNATVTHTPIQTSLSYTGIPVNATINVTYPWAKSAAKVFYKLNRSSTWLNEVMANPGGSNYTATLPAQPHGTVIGYYLALEDKYGKTSGVKPGGANMANPNIPYFILNGVALLGQEDFDANLGSWLMGVSGDNATTGIWTIDEPMGSYSTPGTPGTICQPASQHTAGGTYCAVTGNAASTSDALGANDVDGGETTLESPVYDLSNYQNPIFSYYRWYINNPPSGANPGNDFWETQISNDGTNWVKVERTSVSDKSWRRFAFRVKDYVSLSATVYLRFVVEDSVINGINLSGGSIVEGALDDVFLYEEKNTVSVDEHSSLSGLQVYPNPASNMLFVGYELVNAEEVKMELINNIGEIVYAETPGKSIGVHTAKINTEALAAGIYMLNIKTDTNNYLRKINIVK